MKIGLIKWTSNKVHTLVKSHNNIHKNKMCIIFLKFWAVEKLFQAFELDVFFLGQPRKFWARVIFEPRQANLVLIAYASSEGSGKPAHSRSLARTSAARSYRQ